MATKARLDISRDANGIRHVTAGNETDLYRGLGYCHARDRALQMLLVRILGHGRGSEILDASDDMLRVDRFFRRLNLSAGAADELARCDARTRELAEAYCTGVNEALARRVPWELRILGYRHEPWTVADCFLTARLSGYVALAQSQGDIERLLVEMVQAGVSRSHLDELFPGLLGTLDEDLVRHVRLGERLVPESVRWSSMLPHAITSNNWVVSGQKTKSGFPILANDPHLEINRLPAVWYEVVLRLADRYCIGATMPGIPGVAIGRTNDLAWGATYAFMDAIDSWIEDCRDGAYRRTIAERDQWIPFAVRRETILRKRGTPIDVSFYENQHGVLDGDPNVPGFYLATRWASARATGARSLAAMAGMLHARDVETGMGLLGTVETAWNWVLADRHGNIGYQMSGCMPRRSAGRNGFVPLPGWDPENDWQGLVPHTDLPRALNPERGYLVTANEDLNHLGRAKPINAPMGAYRAERIAEQLATRDDWTVDSIHGLQHDVFSLQAKRYVRDLEPLLPANAAADILRAWDFRYDLDSAGAFLFERFYRALIAEVFGAVCGTDVLRFLLEETGTVADFYANVDRVLLNRDSRWYGDEGREALWRRVAERTVREPIGRWADRQQVLVRHLLFGGRLPRRLGFDRGPIAIPGGRATVHQGQIYRSGGRETTFVPSFRIVTDLAEEAAHTCLAGGPSDRRLSRWYASGLTDWLAHRLKRVEP